MSRRALALVLALFGAPAYAQSTDVPAGGEQDNASAPTEGAQPSDSAGAAGAGSDENPEAAPEDSAPERPEAEAESTEAAQEGPDAEAESTAAPEGPDAEAESEAESESTEAAPEDEAGEPPLADLDAEEEDELGDAHRPDVRVALGEGTPMTGDLVELTIEVDALLDDDISIPADQSFAPFEALDRDVRVQRGDTRALHRFTLQLLALEPGEHEVGPIRVRVLTAEGVIGEVETDTLTIRVGAVLGNEPSAEPQPPSDPVELLEEDPTLYWVGGGLLVIVLTALLTWLLSRWWRRRTVAAAPPPPPRPAHEIALEKLNALRVKRDAMLEAGEGEEFVDGVSDAVREYLGHRYGFEGLESTTDEVLQRIDKVGDRAPRQEIASLLMDCDLVKFARAGFTRDQSELLLKGSFHIVRTTMHAPPSETETAEAAPAPVSAPAAPKPDHSRWAPPAMDTAPATTSESGAVPSESGTFPSESSTVPSESGADTSESSTVTSGPPPRPHGGPVAHSDSRPSGFQPMGQSSEREIPETDPPPPNERVIPDTIPPAPLPPRSAVDTLQGDAFGEAVAAARAEKGEEGFAPVNVPSVDEGDASGANDEDGEGAP